MYCIKQRQVDFYESKVSQGDPVRPYLKANRTPYNMNSELRVREDRKGFWVSSLFPQFWERNQDTRAPP